MRVRRALALLGIATALAGCGAGDDGPGRGASRVGATTVVSSTTLASATTATGGSVTPGTAVTRPGPPAAGVCSVTLDRASTPDGASYALLVRSAVANAPFLARSTDARNATGSGTTDGSGLGSVRVPAAAGREAQVEVSVAGGAETCTIALPPP